MAVLNVTFCGGFATGQTGWPIPVPDYSTSEDLTIGASSVASTAAPALAGIVVVYAEAACRVVVGDTPTALSTSMVIGAGQTRHLPISSGHKVAVIEF